MLLLNCALPQTRMTNAWLLRVMTHCLLQSARCMTHLRWTLFRFSKLAHFKPGFCALMHMSAWLLSCIEAWMHVCSASNYSANTCWHAWQLPTTTPDCKLLLAVRFTMSTKRTRHCNCPPRHRSKPTLAARRRVQPSRLSCAQ
jgi:hypothetical protein